MIKKKIFPVDVIELRSRGRSASSFIWVLLFTYPFQASLDIRVLRHITLIKIASHLYIAGHLLSALLCVIISHTMTVHKRLLSLNFMTFSPSFIIGGDDLGLKCKLLSTFYHNILHRRILQIKIFPKKWLTTRSCWPTNGNHIVCARW